MENLITAFLNNISENVIENKLENFVDNIFVINLDKRTDRWENIIKLFNENNIKKYERVPGKIVCKKDLETYGFELKPSFGNEIDVYKYNIGSLGCFLSHLECIKLAKQRNYKRILIVEDDIKFSKNWEHKISNAIDEINKLKKWDMFYLQYEFFFSQKNNIQEIITKAYGLLSGAGYILNESSYDIILDEAPKYRREIDVFYMDIMQKEYQCFRSVEKIIYCEYISSSNIMIYDKKYLKNQNVNIIENNNYISITSKQLNSTPGIKKLFDIKPKTKYLIKVEGYKSCENPVNLWIGQTNNITILYDINKYELKTTNKIIELEYYNEKYNQIYIGILINKIKQINIETFFIKYIEINEFKVA